MSGSTATADHSPLTTHDSGFILLAGNSLSNLNITSAGAGCGTAGCPNGTYWFFESYLSLAPRRHSHDAHLETARIAGCSGIGPDRSKTRRRGRRSAQDRFREAGRRVAEVDADPKTARRAGEASPRPG